MNGYECHRMEDAAGYVLRALPEGEWESFRYHVAECDQCAEKVAELGFVSHALLNAVPQLSAPADIRERVMVTVRSEAELLHAAGAGADRPATRSKRRFGFAWPNPLAAGALAVVLLAAGLGIGSLLRGGPDASCTTRAAKVDAAAGAGARGELEVCDGSATLALTGMQAPPQGRIYELWLDDPKDRQGPSPAGLFSVRDGRASVDVGDIGAGKAVLVTDEPLPAGSEIPTRTPIVQAVS